MVLPQGVAKFRKTLVSTLEAEQTKLTPRGQELFHKLWDELGTLEAELSYYQEKLEAIAHTHPVCQRLLTIPGIGPLTATALIAAVSEARVFKNGRQCAAW
jgi:transposase